MVALSEHRGDLDGHGTIMKVKHGGGETTLSAVRPCGMGVTPRKALDMYRSLHLTISYLLRVNKGIYRISLELGLVI